MNSLRSEIMSRVKWCGVFAMALLVSAVGLRGAGSDARLADAAERMDRAAIGTLLQQHVDVNAPQIDGMTALHWATYADDLDTAQLLVRAGANAKAANRDGVTPLSLACTNGNSAMVEMLLEAGADPNTTLPGGETALMTAARVGKLASVKALLSRGGGRSAHRRRSGCPQPFELRVHAAAVCREGRAHECGSAPAAGRGRRERAGAGGGGTPARLRRPPAP